MPAVTSLKHLSVHGATPSISEFLPVGRNFAALSCITTLEVTQLEEVTFEDLASLTASFCQLQKLCIRGKVCGEVGREHWPRPHAWGGGACISKTCQTS